MAFPTSKIYLSRRNLLTLLGKLDRVAAGGDSTCCIIKTQGPEPEYQQTMREIAVFAIDDEEYYSAHKRPATEVHPDEEQNLPKPSTGIVFPLEDVFGR